MEQIKISEIEWLEGNVYRDAENGYLWKVLANDFEDAKTLVGLSSEMDITETYSLDFICSSLRFDPLWNVFALKVDMPFFDFEGYESEEPLFLAKYPTGSLCLTSTLDNPECEALFSEEEAEEITRGLLGTWLASAIKMVRP